MQLIEAKTTSVKIETEISIYELPGFDPKEVYFEKTVTTRNGNTKTVWELKTGPKAPENYTFAFVRPKFLEYIKTHHAFDYTDNKLQNLFVDVTHPEQITDDLVFLWESDYDHTLMDKDKNFIPYCVTYDYCGAPFDNESVNLNKEFIDFLKQHPWVVNKDSLEITDIPYYNCREGRDKTIVVKILPDVETYNEIMKDKSLRDDNDSVITSGRCVWNKECKDYFGIRPFLRNQ